MSEQALGPGDVVDRYEIQGVLGQGGMAAVLEVKHVELGTAHALKVLQISVPGLHERLLQEGRIQASLVHPNVCRVTDVVRVLGVPGLVMEMVDGPALDELLANYQPNVDQIDSLARGVLDGVGAAHAAELIHRDLKPANILLAITEDTVVPKVTDFGLAKAVDDSMRDRGGLSTRSGAAMGTPTYMAPEQYRNAKRADHRSDVFSLGCILYELVSGVPAFSGASMASIYEQTVTGGFRPVRGVAPNIPARMEAAITAALQPDPDARPQTVDALRLVWAGEVGDAALDACWEPAHLDVVRSLAPSARTGPRSSITFAEQAPQIRRGPATEPREPVPPAVPGRGRLAMGLVGAGGMAALATFSLFAALAGGAAAWWTWGPEGPTATAPVEPVAVAPDVALAPRPEAPAPVPAAPVPAAPVPAPPTRASPAPAPVRPDPQPSVATGSRFEVVGVDRAWLQGPAGQVKPGVVPPGSYTLHVFFDDIRPTQVLEVTLAEGESRTVRCDPQMKVCR